MIDTKEFYRRFNEYIPGNDPQTNEPVDDGTDIYFERLSMTGLQEMHEYSIDERLYEYLEFKPFVTIDDTTAYLTKLLGRIEGDPETLQAMYWFVRRKTDHRLVGTACVVGLNYSRQSIEWGYGIDPRLWGNGYILQIQEMLKKHVFETLGLNRLEGITIISNERTISSLLAAGMTHEGTFRQYFCKDGVFLDAWKYSMLKQDYFDRKNAEVKTEALYTMADVVEVVSSVLTEDEITEESTMFNTNNWDSLNHMAIMVALFERTGLNFSPLQIANATSVLSITQLLNGKSELK